METPALRIYLREISDYPLLTPDDEVALAERMAAGCLQARELLISHNLRLVVKIARDYRIPTVPLMELVAEGNVGLMKAVERYDPAGGLRFAAMASGWINDAIKAAITNKSRVVRVPDSELRRRRVSGENDQSFVPVEAAVLRDIFAPDGEPPVEKVPRLALTGLLNTLTAREREIVRARFALRGGEPESLRAVGERLGLSFERIRQVQDGALAKLRGAAERLGLRDYLL